MKTVFIFGAGASRQAGGPLMDDFLDRAHDYYRRNKLTRDETTQCFEDVFNAISELSRIHSKSYLDLDNIEILFGAIEMAHLTGKFGDRDQDSIKGLRESMITLIVTTLENHIHFRVEGGDLKPRKVLPPQPYGHFVKVLQDIKQNEDPNDRHEFSFLTFNYDVCLDFALTYKKFPFSYCLDENDEKYRSPLLKLHGSINWGYCEECKKIIPGNFDDARWPGLPGTDKAIFTSGSYLDSFLKESHEHLIEGPPLLVPPTWNKTTYHNSLSRVWKNASKELGTADKIIVIGYSLPETDSFF